MQQQLDELLTKAKEAILESSDTQSLDQIRVKYLGKKGELTELLKGVSKMPVEQRPELGKSINIVKQKLQKLLQEQNQQLADKLMEQQLAEESIDVTLPGRKQSKGTLHPVTLVRERLVEIFKSMGFSVQEGPEIEDDEHNFSALNFAEHHPAKSDHDTFYFEDGRLLRTHTSTVQIRTMKEQKPPLRIITPGRVFRNDSDQTHTPMFHQMEALVIDKHCSFAELKGVLQEFLNHFFEREVVMRLRPSYFPFTEPSAEVDIQHELSGKPEWLEVLGCGMVHPNVLRNVGIDSEEYRGFAFGVGMDRLAMLRYEIPDLRLMFENDLRFLHQFA